MSYFIDDVMQKIYFRADASATIGYGHFIRTLALADMLKDDFDCTFFTCHPTSYQVSEMEKVCPFIPLQEETHSADFLSHLQGDEIVVLDNYFFTTDYQRAIKQKGCRLVCVDDMHDKHYVADVVINHGQTNPALFDVESYTRLCLGFDWALLRKPFLEAAKRKSISSDRIEKVAVCFGGSDIHDITGYFVNQVLRLCTVNSITAVVGDAYTPHSSCVQDSRLVYRSRLTAQEMADLFCDSDLVICSASSVCIEALACGAKVAAGWYVDNQKEFYDLLISNGWIIGLGNVRQPSVDLCNVSFLRLSNTSVNNCVQRRYISFFRNLADNCYLREVRSMDRDLLYKWVNDPIVRQSAFNTDEINYEEHCNWFTRCLQREDVKIYILIENGMPVGQVRLNIEKGEALIDYSIASEYRGRGLGYVIIELISEKVRCMKNVNSLVAHVKAANVASKRVFLKNGFLEYANESLFTLSYKKNI